MLAFSKLNIFGYFIVEFVAVSLGDGVGGKNVFYVSLLFLFVPFFYFSAFSIFCIVIDVFFVVGIARGEYLLFPFF